MRTLPVNRAESHNQSHNRPVALENAIYCLTWPYRPGRGLEFEEG